MRSRLWVFLIYFLFFLCRVAHTTSGTSSPASCDAVETIPRHDQSCSKQGLFTPELLSKSNSVFVYQVSFARKYKNSLSSFDQNSFDQFAYVRVDEIGTRDMLSVTTRVGCERSLENAPTFQVTYATDKPGRPSVYSILLPTCSVKETVSAPKSADSTQSKTSASTSKPTMCTTFIVVQPSTAGLEYQQSGNASLNFTITFRRGVLLSFHRDKFAFQPQKTTTTTKTDTNGFLPEQCKFEQLFGAQPSSSDYNVGLIVQLENSVNFDETHFLNVREYASDFSVKPRTYSSKVKKLGSGSTTLSYPEPETWHNGMFLLFDIETTSGTAYLVSIRANMSTFQELFMNGAGWFMLVILALLMLLAIYQSIRNAHSDEDLQFNFPIVEDNESVGATSDDLNRIPLETYSRSHRKRKHKKCAICHDKYILREALRRLPCSHMFHKKCIDQWLRRRKRCPLCSQHIETAQNVHSRDIELSTSRSTSTSLIDPDDLPFSGYSRPIPINRQTSHVIDIHDERRLSEPEDVYEHSDSNNPFDNLHHDFDVSFSPRRPPTEASSHHQPREEIRASRHRRRRKSKEHSIRDKLDLAESTQPSPQKSRIHIPSSSILLDAHDGDDDQSDVQPRRSTAGIQSFFSSFRPFKNRKKKSDSDEDINGAGAQTIPATSFELTATTKQIDVERNPFDEMQEQMSKRKHKTSDSQSVSSLLTISASATEPSHSHTISMSSTLSKQNYTSMEPQGSREPNSSEPDVSFSRGAHHRRDKSLSEPIAARRRTAHSTRF